MGEKISKIFYPFLIIYLISGCVTLEKGTGIVERNKSSKPEWALKDAYDVEKGADGSLYLTATTHESDTLEAGAEEAFKKANNTLNKYFLNNYFGSSELAENEKVLSEIGLKILGEKKASESYSICDVYYEKREKLDGLARIKKNSYDTYLCLKITRPEELVDVIEKEFKKSLTGGETNEKIAH